MSKYIDAEKLISEIKRRKELLENGTGHPEVMKRVEGVINAYNSILSFIISLQQEQPEVSAGRGWVARDMNNDLHYFSVEPSRSGEKWWDRDYLSMEIDGSLFGELTWEDEPIEVELFIREFEFNTRKQG